jgi:hypothetical protein
MRSLWFAPLSRIALNFCPIPRIVPFFFRCPYRCPSRMLSYPHFSPEFHQQADFILIWSVRLCFRFSLQYPLRGLGISTFLFVPVSLLHLSNLFCPLILSGKPLIIWIVSLIWYESYLFGIFPRKFASLFPVYTLVIQFLAILFYFLNSSGKPFSFTYNQFDSHWIAFNFAAFWRILLSFFRCSDRCQNLLLRSSFFTWTLVSKLTFVLTWAVRLIFFSLFKRTWLV